MNRMKSIKSMKAIDRASAFLYYFPNGNIRPADQPSLPGALRAANGKYMNMNVGTRLMAGFGLVVLLLIGITALAIARLGALNDSTALIVKGHYPKVAIANAVLDGINRAAVGMRNVLVMDDAQQIKEELAKIDVIRKEVSDHIASLDRLLSTEKGRQIFASLIAARTKYAAGQGEFLKLAAAGDRQAARTLLLGSVLADQRAYFEEVRALVKLGGTLMDKGSDDAEANFHTSRAMMAALASLATLLACGFAYWITRSITRPLQQAMHIAQTIASGDLTSRIDARSTDETGQLLQALEGDEHRAGADRRRGAQRHRHHRHRLQPDRGRQPGPVGAHRRTGQFARGDRRLDGRTDQHGQAERRQRAPGQ